MTEVGIKFINKNQDIMQYTICENFSEGEGEATTFKVDFKV